MTGGTVQGESKGVDSANCKSGVCKTKQSIVTGELLSTVPAP